MYFQPSTDKVDISRKLNADERPRFREEEGIYIGERPKVPAKVKNKVENRILYEYERGERAGESKAWFGQDGRLASLPDPSLRAPTRPSPPDEDETRSSNDPALETLFCPPNLLGVEETVATVAQPGVKLLFSKSGEDAEAAAAALTHCQLEVDVASIVFDHHHLFSLEHHLAVRLTEGFAAYQKTLSRQLSLSVHRRLKLLYDAVDELRDKFEIYVQRAERDFQVKTIS